MVIKQFHPERSEGSRLKSGTLISPCQTDKTCYNVIVLMTLY